MNMKTQIDEFIERDCDRPDRDYRNYINGFCEQPYLDGAHLLAPLLYEAMEVLDFYGNHQNWIRSWITNGEEICPSKWKDKLKNEDCALLNSGGGKARLALRSIKQKLGVDK